MYYTVLGSLNILIIYSYFPLSGLCIALLTSLTVKCLSVYLHAHCSEQTLMSCMNGRGKAVYLELIGQNRCEKHA